MPDTEQAEAKRNEAKRLSRCHSHVAGFPTQPDGLEIVRDWSGHPGREDIVGRLDEAEPERQRDRIEQGCDEHEPEGKEVSTQHPGKQRRAEDRREVQRRSDYGKEQELGIEDCRLAP